jgi:hypothetical protein
MLLGAEAGDVIWCTTRQMMAVITKRRTQGFQLTLNGICKYKEMLMITVTEALEILGYGNPKK